MEQLEASKATFNILNQSQFQLPDEAADTYWLLQRWPLALQDELDAAAERIRGYRGDFQQQLQEDQQQLQADLQELQVNRLSAQRKLARLPVDSCNVCNVPMVSMGGSTCGPYLAKPTNTTARRQEQAHGLRLQADEHLLAVYAIQRHAALQCTAACAVLLQVAISKFTRVGGLQAVEERSVAVQDFEAKLEELDRLAETYRVSWAGPGTSATSIHASQLF